MGKKEYYIYVRGKAVPVSEEVYKTYWKITEHEKYLQRKDWKYNVISFSALDYDGHFVDNIIDEKIDLEKIVEVKMQIKELNKSLNVYSLRLKLLLIHFILFNQQKRESYTSSNQREEGQNFRKTEKDFRR